MAFDESLGYDPDEWEECPEPEHFLVFSPFTRYLLTAAAIAFVYYFFKILDEHKNGGEKVVEEAKHIVEDVIQKTENAAEMAGNYTKEAIERAEDLAKDVGTALSKETQHIANEAEHIIDEGLKPAVKTLVESTFDQLPEMTIDDGPFNRPDPAQHIPEDEKHLLKEFDVYNNTPILQQKKANRLSESDEKAMNNWEQERQKLEDERIRKLLGDHEAGGDSNTELTSSNKAYQVLAPPQSHISFETSAPAEINRNLENEFNKLTTINNRDSQLTDYDISDFHAHESVDSPPQPPPHRRTTGDSDDYVKVTPEEPIYDVPPQDVAQQEEPIVQQQQHAPLRSAFSQPQKLQRQKAEEKPRISPTEAAQLQELCQEYDLGLDIPGVEQTPKQAVRVPIAKVTNVPIQKNQSGFVIEEDMLASEPRPKDNKPSQATSRQVRTNEVFERIDTDEHDDMTYAPEIQSVEIPPDQLSDTSDNMIDYFDKVADEADQQIIQMKQEEAATLTKNRQGNQAPQILPAFGSRAPSNSSIVSTGRSVSGSDAYPYRHLRKQSSLLSVLGVTSMQEVLLTINSLASLSEAMRRAGLETTNLIFGIDYTASNKYQGEESFGGRNLHTIHPHVKNPYQQVITILGRTLAPFAGTNNIGVYGFGDAKTGDWGTFNLNPHGECNTLDEVIDVYNSVTPTVALSGPTNFAPLIYQAMEICQKSRDYHILVIIADGQVTNERATRRAIVQACQHPLSIIVVGVGDGPWDMMRVFDESLPKRPWDNFHFVEFQEILKKSTSTEDGDVKLAVQSLLEIPDQYRCICELGLLNRTIPPRGSEIRRELMHNPL